jgi:transcriptional regulator with XRE-family HTH domain
MLATYRRFEVKRPELLPPSRLYSLEPVGVGTPFVESQTGYLARLSQAHALSVSLLFGYELAPLLGKEYLRRAAARSGYACRLFASTFRPLARAMNGVGKGASEWVRILQSLTLRTELRFLTLLPCRAVLSQDQLLRPGRAWCPVCYEEWRARGDVVYEPLLWAVKAVKVCHLHGLPLSTVCSYCQRLLHPLSSHSRPGYCSRCEMWLGAPADRVGATGLSEEQMAAEMWAAGAVGEVIAGAPALERPPERASALDAIRLCLSAHMGKLPALAESLGVNKATLWQWGKGRNMPRLDLLLRLCRHFGVSLLGLITGKEMPTRDSYTALSRRKLRLVNTRRARSALDEDEARRVLLSALEESPPPPLQSVAARIGRDGNTLRYRFARLCRAVVERYACYRKSGRTGEWNEVERVLRAELEKEFPASMAAVARRLGYDSKTLKKRWPELCREISARHAESRGAMWDKVRAAFRSALAETDPLSLSALATRLGLSKTSLYARLPGLCREISTRYRVHGKARSVGAVGAGRRQLLTAA